MKMKGQVMRNSTLWLVFFGAVWLSGAGCAKESLVFHERTSLSFSVNANPAGAETLQTNLGYKRNMVAFVPSKDEKNGTPGNSRTGEEPVNLIATFETKTQAIDENKKWLSFIWQHLSPNVVIETNFATGKAAFALTEGDSAVVQGANDIVKTAKEMTKTVEEISDPSKTEEKANVQADTKKLSEKLIKNSEELEKNINSLKANAPALEENLKFFTEGAAKGIIDDIKGIDIKEILKAENPKENLQGKVNSFKGRIKELIKKAEEIAANSAKDKLDSLLQSQSQIPKTLQEKKKALFETLVKCTDTAFKKCLEKTLKGMGESLPSNSSSEEKKVKLIAKITNAQTDTELDLLYAAFAEGMK